MEKPTWAKALVWFNDDAELCGFADCPWDFNLWGDSTPYWHVTPAKGLWDRLYKRRDALGALLREQL